ncbi:hypothetical protein DB347_11395 [Opitutaceae bacterium EW11]|nr:hypothetical protein DB347_11395 [Opitutaceae bacterium EW11]
MSTPSRPSQLSFAQKFDVWWQFAVRAVEMKHRGSYLGVLWTVLNPLLMLGLYVTVFGFIFKNRFHALPNETPVDFALGVFAGLILFHVFAEALAAAPTYITSNPNLVKKVVFPLDLLPLANVTALWFHAAVSFVLLLIAALVFDRIPTASGLLWLIPILVPHLLLCIGAGWLFAAIGVFFRDVSQVMAFATQVILYASAVFYSVDSVQREPVVWFFLRWNPMLHTIDATRRALLWDMPVDSGGIAYTWAVGLIAFIVGRWFFKKTQPGFADVI